MPDPRRLSVLIAPRERYPSFRVDLTELFGRHLARTFDLTWAMARADAGPGGSVEDAGGRFELSGRAATPGAIGAAIDLILWLALQARLAVRVARGGFDIVQVRDMALSGLMFLGAARIGRTPFVYWMSFPILEAYRLRARRGGPLGGPARRLYAAFGSVVLYRMALPAAAHVFVQSERMADDLVRRGLPRARLTAVPMGVSTDVHNVARIAMADDPRLTGRIVLLYQGAFEPERGADFLPDVLAEVVRAGFDAVLVVTGGGSERDIALLMDRASERGVAARMLFTGHLPLEAALGYVRRADICLAPYPVTPDLYLSATPTKLVEYLAMGRPVVANHHPDQSVVIRESGAGVIAPLTAVGFAAAVTGLLRAPEYSAAMGARGPAWVAANRDYAALAENVAADYRRLARRSD